MALRDDIDQDATATQPERPPEALALAAQRGDRDAFAVLVESFEAPLVGFLFARTGNREDAVDLAQESFLRAWQALERYDPRWRFSTWLYTIASRLATSRARKVGGRRDRGEDGLGALSACNDPDARLHAEELSAGLWATAHEVLSEEQRAALWLRYVDDLTADEIGEALGRPAVTVRVILFRARERLGKHLDPEHLLEPAAPSGPEAGALFARRVSGGSL